MAKSNSFEQIAEVHLLLKDIKKEYSEGIQKVLKRNQPKLFGNIHTIPKLEKIKLNRGLGLKGQNKNFLKKSISEFELITGQKPVITKSKKSIASFKIREDMDLGLTVTLRGQKMYAFLTKLIFFTFSQIRDFRGLSVRSFDKAGNYTFGLKEQLIKISRISKVTKGGKKISFRVVLVVGDDNGKVGLGVAKASDVSLAFEKARSNGYKNLIQVSLTKSLSIPHQVEASFGACKLILKPAMKGSGVIAGGATRSVLQRAGIKNVIAKQLGANNLLNNAKATICALEKLTTKSAALKKRNLIN